MWNMRIFLLEVILVSSNLFPVLVFAEMQMYDANFIFVKLKKSNITCNIIPRSWEIASNQTDVSKTLLNSWLAVI